MHLTVVKPAILKAIQRIEQRHVEKANGLSNGIDWEQANNHTLELTIKYIIVSQKALWFKQIWLYKNIISLKTGQITYMPN